MVVRPPSILLAVAVVLVGTSGSAARPARVRVSGRVASGRVVSVVDDHGSREALRLPAWASVEDVVVSPSHHHALVYAFLRPHEPRTAFVLDLERGGVAGSFRPGVGGSFAFSATDSVIQVAGCGTECVVLLLHDQRGQQLGPKRVCDGFDHDTELSPDRRFVACVTDGRAHVIDASNGREVLTLKAPCSHLARPEVAFSATKVAVSTSCDPARPAAVLEAPLPLPHFDK